ncbi:MAG: Hpt domain-containing protein, partial [Oligoflexales bacterium]|nr:Hpt domain-containing protein [Oligoflexales bacterium]
FLFFFFSDITHLKELEQDYDELRLYTQIVEILVQGGEKEFIRFLDKSSKTVNAWIRIDGNPSDIMKDDLKKVYRDIHTIKGNARFYKLSGLTKLAHEVEDNLNKYMSEITEFSHTEFIIKDLSMLDEYIRQTKIALDNLNTRLGSRQKSIMDHEISKTLWDHLNGCWRTIAPSVSSIPKTSVMNRLFEIGSYQEIEGLEFGLRDMINDIAGTVKKSAPELVIIKCEDGILIDPGFAVSIRDMIIHMIRNTIDHGIPHQSDDSAGRPRITLEFGFDGSQFVFHYRDSGQGLDLAGIREKAIKVGIVDSAGELSANELSDLIFEPFFSTKSDVTTISGRGIGMDFIRSETQRWNGKMKWAWPEGVESKDRVPFSLVFHFPDSLAYRLHDQDQKAAA